MPKSTDQIDLKLKNPKKTPTKQIAFHPSTDLDSTKLNPIANETRKWSEQNVG